jgi:ABC-type antimicrobial peptide transport system, ATPase component
MSLIELNGINKIYNLGEVQFHALHDVNLRVEEGEFVAILGPSGSGKTTLMNIIGCLDEATTGEYYLDGLEITKQKDRRLCTIRNEKIGFIFQNFNLLPRMSAIDNVMLPLIYAKVEYEDRVEIALEMLNKVGLLDKADNFPRQLSGGQQQRVAIARAIATAPSIVLADEPTGALDQKTGRQVIELLQMLNREGKTIVMITHDLNIAQEAKRIVRILDGRLYEGDGL